jgi:ubiquinone/menaquinone biosynthesis C-methylase UbiE
MAETGVDGLTTETLRASRTAWWDDAFTARLLDAFPSEVEQIVEVGCGLGQAAHALLPQLARAEYLGVDVDASRIALAREELARHGARAQVVVGSAEALPLAAASADLVLFSMTLQHLVDPAVGVREAVRVLRTGGRVVAAEPDNLGIRFYFDGLLPEVDRAVAALVSSARELRAPADSAIGPRVGGLLIEAGLASVTAIVQLVHTTRIESANAFTERVLRMARVIAAPLPADALDSLVAALSVLSERGALASITTPIFITSGIAR